MVTPPAMPYFLTFSHGALENNDRSSNGLFVCKILNSHGIMDIGPAMAMPRRLLTYWYFTDKVLHAPPETEDDCNTLSESTYIRCQTKSTPLFPFRGTTMLDDRAACRQVAVFDPVDSPFSVRGWLLQQLHPTMGDACTLRTIPRFGRNDGLWFPTTSASRGSAA